MWKIIIIGIRIGVYTYKNITHNNSVIFRIESRCCEYTVGTLFYFEILKLLHFHFFLKLAKLCWERLSHGI